MTQSSIITLIEFGLKGKVFRSPLPHGAFDPQDRVLAEWQAQGVRVIFSLIEEYEWLQKARLDARPWLTAQGIQRIAFPIKDFAVPAEPPAAQAAAASALRMAATGINLAIHCNAGWGRTGLFLSEMAIQHFGFGVDEAVAWVRQFVPLAVENETQLAFLRQLHAPSP